LIEFHQKYLLNFSCGENFQTDYSANGKNIRNFPRRRNAWLSPRNSRKILLQQISRTGSKMKKIIIAIFIALVCFSASNATAQIPSAVLVKIVKAEDERRYDKTLEDLIKNPNSNVRARAILAAGRIGDERAVPMLSKMVGSLSRNPEVDAMAAFALGEIESIKAADSILVAIRDGKLFPQVRARAIEAAGKIAAANPNEPKSKELGEAILDALDAEDANPKSQSREVILLGLTAILRVRPEEGNVVAAKFLTNLDARIRADAANTLTRLRAKNANEALRAMLLSDADAVARANAARALGAAEDKESFQILLDAATEDEDQRVRVSAIRALGALKDAKAADKLLERGEKLMAVYKTAKLANPPEKNELLEIATVLGRLLPNTNDKKAVGFLKKLREADKYTSSETEIAFARVAPETYINSILDEPGEVLNEDWRANSAAFQGLGEIANLPANKENDAIKSAARLLLVRLIGSWFNSDARTKANGDAQLAVPDLLRAFAAFKSENTSNILRPIFEIEKDLFIRAAVAEILADQPASKENVEALKAAFSKSLVTDKDYNDAQLAILDALFKLDKKESVGTLLTALNAPDYLVRKKAFELLRTKDLEKDSPGISALLANAAAKKKNQLVPYSPVFGTKLGSILNTNADYLRAVSRKNASTRAILTTEKGVFTIDLFPEDAPLTVDNFIKLARSGYFNGLTVHRVVPNFVMQDGDPRGDGNGGPGWEIRCELNMFSYERGMVGMALSGKDTGGSQWFVTHSPQPHLDGGYTIFGRVNESDMKIVDAITRGDKIVNVKIIEGKSTQKKGKK
jgi:cyclophilin family peptidyl-prolyl cis-trans isomerase/HEAT repeat protein